MTLEDGVLGYFAIGVVFALTNLYRQWHRLGMIFFVRNRNLQAQIPRTPGYFYAIVSVVALIDTCTWPWGLWAMTVWHWTWWRAPHAIRVVATRMVRRRDP